MTKKLDKMEIIETMISENHNEIERCEIMERMYCRLGVIDPQYRQIQAMNQSKLKTFKKTLDALIDIRNDMVKETEPTSIPPAA